MLLLLIEDIRNLCHDECIALTKHAKSRLTERSISIEDIKNALQTGEIFKSFNDFYKSLNIQFSDGDCTPPEMHPPKEAGVLTQDPHLYRWGWMTLSSDDKK